MASKTTVWTALLLSISLSVEAQTNRAAFMWSSASTNEPMRLLGVPTNYPAYFISVGTNTTAPAPFVFVGNAAAEAAFIAARVGPYLTWSNNVWNLQAPHVGVLAQSNRLFQINATLVTLSNLYQTNINFMGLVATNRPAVTVVVLSNQTVTVTRILNQLGPLFRELYAPKVAAETP